MPASTATPDDEGDRLDQEFSETRSWRDGATAAAFDPEQVDD
jgi:hypothetical protein